MVQTINLQPILFLLGLAGCYSFEHDRLFVNVAFWIYKFIIFTSSALWTSRFFIQIQIDGASAIVGSITVVLLCLQCFGNWLICCKAFSKRFGNLKKSNDLLQDSLRNLLNNNVRINFAFIYRRQCICVVSAVFLIISDISIQVLNAYVFQQDIGNHIDSDLNSTSDFSRESNVSEAYSSMTFPFKDSYLTRVVVLLPLLFLTCALIVPPFYLAVINFVFIALFRAVDESFGDFLTKPDSKAENIEIFRQQHLALSALVNDFDKDYQYLYGNIFFWMLCQAILSLYILIKFEQHYIIVLSILLMMGLCLTVLAVMAISAALVHEAAHAPLSTIYKINVETISLEKATEINLFLSKLTGTQIGFTTFGLLTITKEFILTIAGVFLTYFAVLYTL